MLEFVLSALWEIVLQLAGELLLELGFSAVGEPFRERKRSHPVLAGAGVFLIGAVLGAATRLAWPGRIFPPGPVPGVSLLLSPLATGLIMHSYGEWCERRGTSRSFVETFWGGALFAFGMALVRFLWVAA
jgi:hypothetical protein